MTKEKRRYFALFLAFSCATTLFAEKTSNVSNFTNNNKTASVNEVNAVKQDLRIYVGVVTD